MSSFTSTSARIALAAFGAGLMAAPVVVHAQDHYDGYCYMRKHEARTNDAIIGAVAGGALGGTVANTHNKGAGTVLGAAVGAAIGANIGSDSVKCYNGEYYSFDRGSFAPPPPPEGYETVYYNSRPDTSYYKHVEYHSTTTYQDGDGGYTHTETRYSGDAPQGAYAAPPPAYAQNTDYYGDGRDRSDAAVQGFRDEDGRWHRGEPRAIGWQDEDGNWHEGRITAYGWRDGDGHWHEERQQDQGNGY